MLRRSVKYPALLIMLLVSFGACKKDSYEKQLKSDEALIVEFLAKNSISATRHSSGLYYQIIQPGSGKTISANSTVSAVYEGRLLDGTIFDKTTNSAVSFNLGGVIQGWTIGVPLIKEGGEIRLIIPSVLAYGKEEKPGLPKNSILDFKIAITRVQ